MRDEALGRRTWFLAALMASTALFKLLLGLLFPAFLTGDDLEVVETAARYAVGLDYQPWDIRSLFHPLVLAFPCVKAAAAAGLASPRAITFFATLPDVAFSTLGIWVLHRLARELDWSEPAARAGAFLYAVHWLPLAYGATPFPRPISSVLLLCGFLLAARRERPGAAFACAGLLAACAFAVRWSEGLIVIPLLTFAWSRSRRLKPLALLAAGFAAGILLAVGLFDAVTWGRPFASLAAMAQFSRVPDLGGFHAKPWFWYGWTILRWLGPALLLLCFFAWPDRRTRLPSGLALLSAALLSLSPLKELRYLQICIPLLALSAALAWERLHAAGAWRRLLSTLAIAASLAWGVERTVTLMRAKSQSAVEAAQFLRALSPPVETVALEQMWAYGEKLYLGNGVAIRDVAKRRPLAPEAVASRLVGADAAAFYDLDVGPEASRLLAESGFIPCARFQRHAAPAVTVYVSSSRPCPVVPAP